MLRDDPSSLIASFGSSTAPCWAFVVVCVRTHSRRFRSRVVIVAVKHHVMSYSTQTDLTQTQSVLLQMRDKAAHSAFLTAQQTKKRCNYSLLGQECKIRCCSSRKQQRRPLVRGVLSANITNGAIKFKGWFKLGSTAIKCIEIHNFSTIIVVVEVVAVLLSLKVCSFVRRLSLPGFPL